MTRRPPTRRGRPPPGLRPTRHSHSHPPSHPPPRRSSLVCPVCPLVSDLLPRPPWSFSVVSCASCLPPRQRLRTVTGVSQVRRKPGRRDSRADQQTPTTGQTQGRTANDDWKGTRNGASDTCSTTPHAQLASSRRGRSSGREEASRTAVGGAIGSESSQSHKDRKVQAHEQTTKSVSNSCSRSLYMCVCLVL